MDMTDAEIKNLLRQPRVTVTTSTPAVAARTPPRRVYDNVADCFPTPLSSGLQDVQGSSVAEKERRAVEMPQELQRRHQELEVTLAEERGRRKACQEMMERVAILQRELVPLDLALGPGRGPVRDDS